jgi:hypothetical protein
MAAAGAGVADGADDEAVALGADDAVAVGLGAAEVDDCGAAAGGDESPPRMTNHVATTAITATATPPTPIRPHGVPFCGDTGAGEGG